MLTVDFVDSIATSPEPRLNLADGTTFKLESAELPPPPLRQVVASSMLRDGAVIPSSAYGLRQLTLTLLVDASTADATATALQSLYRELDRPAGNILRWEDSTTHPIFFRTFRASPTAVEKRFGPVDGKKKRVTVDLLAEPFGYGTLETPISVVTINTNPAAGGNDCFVDIPGNALNSNPDFETTISPWTTVGGSAARLSTWAHSGAWSALITPDGVTSIVQLVSERVPVVVGNRYLAYGWLRSAGGWGGGTGISVHWYDQLVGGTLLSTSTDSVALSAGVEIERSNWFIAPAGAVSADVFVRIAGTPAAVNTVAADQVMLQDPTTGIKGDVEAPAYIRYPASGTGTETLFAVRRRGTPSGAPFLFQAEAMTQGTNTTTQVNDANFSGTGNNYSRCTFTTATMQTRLSLTDVGTESVDLRGRYRVYLRYRKNTAGDAVSLQLRWGDLNGDLQVDNDAYATPSNNLIQMADLGEISIPGSFDPVYGPDGVEMPVSDAFVLALRAERTSGSGSIDFDFILLVPSDDRLAIAGFDSTQADHWMLYAGDNSAYGRDTSGRVEAAGRVSLIGGLPMLSPNQTNRVYILRTVQPSQAYTLTTVANISISYWPRYLTVRPVST